MDCLRLEIVKGCYEKSLLATDQKVHTATTWAGNVISNTIILGNGTNESINRMVLDTLRTLESTKKYDWKSPLLHPYNCCKGIFHLHFGFQK